MRRHRNRGNLCESDELLLMKYCDGECGVFERIRARRLLERAPEAREYLECLDRERELLSSSADVQQIDLWHRIERRIDEEERAALFLGKRVIREDRGTFLNLFQARFAGVVSGVSGGAIAALAIVLFVQGTSQKEQLDGDTRLPERGVERLAVRPTVPPARLVSTTSRPVRERLPVELEWMRSEGRVRIIQDSRSGAPIIWVKRRGDRPIVVRRSFDPSLREQYSSEGETAVVAESPIPTSGRELLR